MGRGRDARYMTSFFESYYGPYDPLVRQVVEKYAQNWRPDVVMAVIEWTCETLENRFKMPPDVAYLKKAFNAVIDRVDMERMARLALPEVADPAVKAQVAELLSGLSRKLSLKLQEGGEDV